MEIFSTVFLAALLSLARDHQDDGSVTFVMDDIKSDLDWGILPICENVEELGYRGPAGLKFAFFVRID